VAPHAGIRRVKRLATAGPWKAVIERAGLGVCTSDYRQLDLQKVRRPIYALDWPNR
jgi:hypothetical protein